MKERVAIGSKIQPRATIINSILCSAWEDLKRASRPPLESGVIISNQFRLSATAGWARRKSQRRLPCRSDTGRESAEDSGQGSHDTSLKWHTWLIPFSPLRTPHSFRTSAALLSLFLGLSACTAYETRPGVSNHVAFSQYKGSISHSLQHQSVNHCGKETVGLCIHRTFRGEDGTPKNFPSSL